MIVEKIVPDAVMPSRAKDGDVGYDLVLVRLLKVEKGVAYFGTGLRAQPPAGHHLEIVGRSSLPSRGWMLANSLGVIDQGYTGEIIVALTPTPSALLTECRRKHLFSPDDVVRTLAQKMELPARYAQIVVRQSCLPEVMEGTVVKTERGGGGFGSTG